MPLTLLQHIEYLIKNHHERGLGTPTKVRMPTSFFEELKENHEKTFKCVFDGGTFTVFGLTIVIDESKLLVE